MIDSYPIAEPAIEYDHPAENVDKFDSIPQHIEAGFIDNEEPEDISTLIKYLKRLLYWIGPASRGRSFPDVDTTGVDAYTNSGNGALPLSFVARQVLACNQHATAYVNIRLSQDNGTTFYVETVLPPGNIWVSLNYQCNYIQLKNNTAGTPSTKLQIVALG